jgi:hypothetical protein
MKKNSFFLIAAVLFISCNSSKQSTGSNSLSSEEKRSGWTLLFDGRSTKGWHRYGGGAIDSVWKVKDDVLCLDAAYKKANNIKGDWDIVTEEEFENFEMETDWKISRNGNSGIVFMIHEDKKKFNWPWETGPEMQVLDNNGHPDAKYPKHRAGDLYDLIACSTETVKPAGEWNHAKIRLLNGKLDLYLNEVNVVSTILWDENWKKLVANSKWKGYPSFATYHKGRVGLQDHGDEVCYRNIKIRRL